MSDDADIRAAALELAIEATRPVPVPVSAQAPYFTTASLPSTSTIVQTAAVFEAYLRNGAIQ